jgi:hypothetical protein
MEWTETHYQLSNGTLLKIYHNLGDEINNAFENWIVRTKKYTEKSFCNYINYKNKQYLTGHIAYTETEYKHLIAKTG